MIDKIIGFIGAGNMGSAMIGGILDAHWSRPARSSPVPIPLIPLKRYAPGSPLRPRSPMKPLQNAVIFCFSL